MKWTCLPTWWPLPRTTGQTWSQRSNTGTALHGYDVELSTNMVAIAQDYRADMEPEVKHRYGVHVHGVDLSTNMVAIAQDYRADMEPEVKHRYSPACSWCGPVYQHGDHCPGLQGRHTN